MKYRIASLFTLCILLYIAFLLGKSLEGFIPPVIVLLLLTINGMRRSKKQSACYR
ncbi:hypothetical protein [Pelagicoccus sp. SDUM812002]|uniref:hypothetical protein n=1 Tax=Pelagicoccus sp. SDUM812002 TaxID=3041266 RepID=UPI00280E6FA3|nr:hypothetical protein [Pelagicoccus sp. SDUM812002]MDQ8187932.1 hypothetical protein [Pelagicoccus sp. SDUM812002]